VDHGRLVNRGHDENANGRLRAPGP
jgi:hypothetical protein